jgi:hypothetical protein
LWQGTGGAVIDAIGTGLLYIGYDLPTKVVLGYNGGKVGIDNDTPESFLHIGRSNIGFGRTVRMTLEPPYHGGAGWEFSVRDDQNSSFLGIGYGAEQFTMHHNGNIGIGTTNPLAKLHIAGDNSITIGDHSSSAGLRSINFAGWRDVVSNYYGASIEAEPVWVCCNNYPSGGYAGVKHIALNFNVHNPADWSAESKLTALRINHNGNVGIGTTNPDAKLAVKGTIHAEEVKVDLNVQGPDYVFEPTYNLKPLSEIETYIKANKHLPEVPSAKEMEANGINLSEMNMLLLKKVEELTLLLIQQEKRIQELEKNK